MKGEVTSMPPKTSVRRIRRRSSGVVVPHAPRWYQRLAAWCIFAAIRVVSLTLRYRWTDGSGLLRPTSPGNAICCTWHNRLVLSMVVYYGYVQPRTASPGIAAMVSASKDGGFLAAILECFGVEPVRGSSSRRGPQALLELTTWSERGYDLAITPDGPRGPRYEVQEGTMSLAQVTGLPIIPFAFNLSWKIQANSWDKFQIPLPFGRCEIITGEALRVPREASDAEREALRKELERRLREITKD
jgi:lysophospholipid acyltransferase (LPLAT)-like uncharacterized protein